MVSGRPIGSGLLGSRPVGSRNTGFFRSFCLSLIVDMLTNGIPGSTTGNPTNNTTNYAVTFVDDGARSSTCSGANCGTRGLWAPATLGLFTNGVSASATNNTAHGSTDSPIPFVN